MSWGTELWDQFENIAIHTQKGLEFCERYGHFLKERAAIEKDYAAKLKKLVKNYQPKKKDDEDSQFTVTRGFNAMIQEINDIAGQHETISENLNTIVTSELAQMLQEQKGDRKRFLQEGADQMKNLQIQLSQLERSKKQYEKASRDADRAQEAYKKADADINLSRADVEKAKNTSLTKQQYCEDCKNEYASELQKTNLAQQSHYQQQMPSVFQNLQDMDEKRISRIQEFIRMCAETERNVMPIIHTCIDGMVRAAEKVDHTKDSRIVIERYQSGLQPPGDIPFEDLSGSGHTDNHIHSNTPRGSLRTDTLKSNVSGGKSKKRTGIFGIFGHSKMIPRDRSLRGSINGLFRTDDSKEDYSHLPPNQQKRKLQQKIDVLVQAIAKETAERDGMLKMRDVYVQNPALGDASSLDKQVDENAQKLDKLRQELQKYEGYMAEAVGRLSAQKQVLSTSDDSIPRSMSEVSVSSSDPSTPQQTHQTQQSVAQDSPDGGVANPNRPSYVEQDSFDDGLEEYPVIGVCQALYTFEATNEGSIPMTEGEDFSVLEQDQGDGWTRVRRVNGEEGFVPTSYIEVTIYQ